MPHTLIIGGTGPTGRTIIDGLLSRGHKVSLLHTGQHEIELPVAVEHIHTDPHFKETLTDSLAGRTFDAVIATYGRVRVIADVVADCTSRLITVSGSSYAGVHDSRWGPVGVPMLVSESGSPLQNVQDDRAIPHKAWVAEQYLQQLHSEGAFSVTTIRYPFIYGPGTPANPDWSVVRRALDKRPTLLLGDGGRRIRNRGYGPNVAHAALLAVDNPITSHGKIYNVADIVQYPQRAIAQYVAQLVGHEFEIIDIPGDLAARLYRDEGTDLTGYYCYDTSDIQRDLGYVDTVPIVDAIARSVEWLVANPVDQGSEIERQLGDPFNYDIEDELATVYRNAYAEASQCDLPTDERAHMYRHPTKPFEAWTDPVALAQSGD
jgi:nucleoside-diphosphate-sugar epimerase